MAISSAISAASGKKACYYNLRRCVESTTVPLEYLPKALAVITSTNVLLLWQEF